MRLTLAPARTKPGELIGELTVFYQPFRLLANINNFGSNELGRYTAYGRAEIYGLTRAQDMTYIAASTTTDLHEEQVVQVGHVLGIGANGATLGGHFAYAWSRPDLSELDPNGTLNIRSTSLIGRLEATMPLIRTRRNAITLRGGLELLQQRTDSSFGLITDDKLRVAFLRAESGFHEPVIGGGDAYSLHWGLELRKGLGIFGASDRYNPLASRFDGDPQAFVVRADLGGAARLPSVFSLAVDGEGQWSNHPLLAFEEYSVGNYTIGRGYDPGSITADRAIAIRPEISSAGPADSPDDPAAVRILRQRLAVEPRPLQHRPRSPHRLVGRWPSRGDLALFPRRGDLRQAGRPAVPERPKAARPITAFADHPVLTCEVGTPRVGEV